MLTASKRPARRDMRIGDRLTIVMPHSEVMVHMGLAGKRYEILLTGAPGLELVQVLNARGVPFTTVLPSEAGVYRGTAGHYAYVEVA